jgi:hypothetical protein
MGAILIACGLKWGGMGGGGGRIIGDSDFLATRGVTGLLFDSMSQMVRLWLLGVVVTGLSGIFGAPPEAMAVELLTKVEYVGMDALGVYVALTFTGVTGVTEEDKFADLLGEAEDVFRGR